MNDVSWKLKGLAKGVDPSIAHEELQRLQSKYGSLTPEVIVNEAKSKKSPLHPIFEWDNDKAAANYRLQQARILLNNIQVTIITDGEPRQIAVYEVTTLNERYKSIDTFTPDDIDYIKTSTRHQLSILKHKLALYNEFDKVLFHINQAIEILN